MVRDSSASELEVSPFRGSLNRGGKRFWEGNNLSEDRKKKMGQGIKHRTKFREEKSGGGGIRLPSRGGALL